MYRAEEPRRPVDHGAADPGLAAEAAPGVAGAEPHGRVVALGQGEVPASPAAAQSEVWTHRIPPERPISPKTRAEMSWKSIAPLPSKTPWRGCGSAMRCTSIGRLARRIRRSA